MKRAKVVAMLLAVALAGSACGGQHAAQRPLENPTTSPLTAAPAATTTPRPLSDLPSLYLVEADATRGPSRADAEQYALDVAHLLTDVRPGLSGALAVSRIAASSMSPSTRAFLVQDMDLQHKIGLQRHLDTGLDMWIRSLPEGPADTPVRVAVEIAANLAGAANFSGKPGGFHAWYRMRLDVVQERDGWRLAAWSGGPSGPHLATNLTAVQQQAFLTGPGWRRIPAR